MMEDIEIIKYMDKKFEQMSANQRSGKRWWSGLFLTLCIALITSGLIGASIIGGLQVTTENIKNEYVPADLLYVIMSSYDYQGEYFLSLLNGDKEGAEEKFKEFVQFRKEMYALHFKIRGSPSPTGGRTSQYSNK